MKWAFLKDRNISSNFLIVLCCPAREYSDLYKIKVSIVLSDLVGRLTKAIGYFW